MYGCVLFIYSYVCKYNTVSITINFYIHNMASIIPTSSAGKVPLFHVLRNLKAHQVKIIPPSVASAPMLAAAWTSAAQLPMQNLLKVPPCSLPVQSAQHK